MNLEKVLKKVFIKKRKRRENVNVSFTTTVLIYTYQLGNAFRRIVVPW